MTHLSFLGTYPVHCDDSGEVNVMQRHSRDVENGGNSGEVIGGTSGEVNVVATQEKLLLCRDIVGIGVR